LTLDSLLELFAAQHHYLPAARTAFSLAHSADLRYHMPCDHDCFTWILYCVDTL